MTEIDQESQCINQPNGSPLNQAPADHLLLALNALKQLSLSTIDKLRSVLISLDSNDEHTDLFNLTLADVNQKEDQPKSPINSSVHVNTPKSLEDNSKQLDKLDTKIILSPEQQTRSPQTFQTTPEASQPSHSVTPKKVININARQAQGAAASVKRSLSLEQDLFLGQKTLPNPFPRSTAINFEDSDLRGNVMNYKLILSCTLNYFY